MARITVRSTPRAQAYAGEVEAVLDIGKGFGFFKRPGRSESTLCMPVHNLTPVSSCWRNTSPDHWREFGPSDLSWLFSGIPRFFFFSSGSGSFPVSILVSSGLLADMSLEMLLYNAPVLSWTLVH